MIFKVLLTVSMFISALGWSQKDSPFKSPKFKLNWDVPTKSESKSNTITLPFKSILDKDDSYLKRYSILKKDKGQESVLVEKNKFKNPGEDLKNKLNNQDKAIQPEYRSNQFLGEFKTKAKYVKIICRDHEYPDGDRVKLMLNDRTIIHEILLEATVKEYYIDITNGFNKLDFEALNQGTSGPNTAAFSVYDDSGNLITSNEWNLTTGIKATIVVVKEEDKK
jgi:hypothetical protein